MGKDSVRLSDLIRYELNMEAESFRYRSPMKFGGRVVEDVTIANVTCRGELRNGSRSTASTFGFGSMTMGVAWAWPSHLLSDAQKLQAVLALMQRLVDWLHQEQCSGHPLEICHHLSEHRAQLAKIVELELALPEPIPSLAQLLAGSPIEAALFDCQAKALQVSSYALLGPDFLSTDLEPYLGADYRGLYLEQFVSRSPRSSMPLYHLVGALDPLTSEELATPIIDGLPETLGQWIARDGLSHLKIKLAGDDFDWDMHRILQVDRVASAHAAKPHQLCYSLDFNERCQSSRYVLDLLDELHARSPETLQRVQYIEQPTHRDLAKHPENVMHEVAKRLPVVIDESLVDLASLRLAVEQGYSGIALKACKGHSEALLMAAVAQHDKLYLCVQDLTCVGASLLHSASLASHIPGVTAMESNGRQYCPAANLPWLDRYRAMFEVQGGMVPTSCLDGWGLGF